MTEFESYCWPVVFRGRHLFAMPNKQSNSEKDSFLAYLCPLVSLIIEKANLDQRDKVIRESGFIKRSVSRTQNGPLLLIVCPSCKNAQRIYEVVNEMLEMNNNRQRHSIGPKKKVRAILLQGGGNEDQYDVPLINGCDILIAATPFCLLRMIGRNRTNLERLQYLVFDEAYLLLEKFSYQIKVLMSRYLITKPKLTFFSKASSF